MQSSGTTVEPTTGDQFVELLCADDDLLRAEFDAIIAASWHDTPSGGRGDEPAVADHADRLATPLCEPRPLSGKWHPNAERRRRQRSPPHR
ncbi:MAG TPA: hypothetical protein VFE19_05830 [Jatrophihabitantaceae bacterium]|nr:hypothetical protein [Jatrophihabitantaceae bacterium]